LARVSPPISPVTARPQKSSGHAISEDRAFKTKYYSLLRSIVAVHGLGGLVFDTWTNKRTKTCWIKDVLPDKFPHARVMAFGYNAKRINHGAEIEFLDVARQLLAGLSRKRSRPEVGELEMYQRL